VRDLNSQQMEAVITNIELSEEEAEEAIEAWNRRAE